MTSDITLDVYSRSGGGQILRVAARNSATFEWIHHAHVGVDAGLTAPQLTVIRDLATPLPEPSSPAPLSALQAAALRYADASTFNVTVPQRTVDALKKELGDNEQQLLEATATVATYNMVSRLLVALDVGDMGATTVPYPECIEEEHMVEVDPDVKLYVRTAKRDDSAPWLVFVNSLMTNWSMWDLVLPRLSKSFNLIVYDQRGHGKVSFLLAAVGRFRKLTILPLQSSVPPQGCSIAQLAEDITKILKTLSIPTPIHAVVGVSQGGATTLGFARAHGELAKCFVACDTQAASPAANAKAWDDRIALARAEGMGALADATVPRWFPPPSELRAGGRKESWLWDMVANTSVDGFARGANALQGYDVLPGLAEALKDKRILLVAGERDGALPAGLAKLKETLESQGAPSVALEVIPGSGHLPMCDNAQTWLDAVEKFLTSA